MIHVKKNRFSYLVIKAVKVTFGSIYLFLMTAEEHRRGELSDTVSIGHTGIRDKGFNWRRNGQLFLHNV